MSEVSCAKVLDMADLAEGDAQSLCVPPRGDVPTNMAERRMLESIFRKIQDNNLPLHRALRDCKSLAASCSSHRTDMAVGQ